MLLWYAQEWIYMYSTTNNIELTLCTFNLTFLCECFITQMEVVMVFNATFNSISVISWWSILLVEETSVPRENHRPPESHGQTLSHNVVSSTPRLSWIRTHNVSGDSH
jgi:hypothetical protein